MGVLLGILLHFVGGFASGSFYIPYKKVRGGVGKVTGWLVVSLVGQLHPLLYAIYWYRIFGPS